MNDTPLPSFQPSAERGAKRPGGSGSGSGSGSAPVPQRRSAQSSQPKRQPAQAQSQPLVQPPSYAPRRKVSQPTPAASSPDVSAPAPQINKQNAVPTKTKRKKRRGLKGRHIVAGLVAAALIGWPVFLLMWTNAHLNRVDALVPGPDSPGTTYLVAGSDGRDPDSGSQIEGERADSIMLIREAPGGQASIISLPRDLYVEIPEVGWNKINASYSFGGPELLVETVQNLTGLKIDHYLEIGMQGFAPLVDAVGGVELCSDLEVDDKKSKLKWEPGCHQSDGETALAFARMRYQDPRGDLGRAERQRDVIKAVTKKALTPATLLNPVSQWKLANAGAEALTVDEKTSPIAIGKLLLTFRSASSSGMTGTPPLASVGEATDVGSVVLLDEALAPMFFEQLRDGTLTKADFDTDF